MYSIELLEELHSNTRRTRITYKAAIGDRLVALKCYRKPLWGWFHWWRAHRRGYRIRKAGASFPAVAFSGWVPAVACFGFGTEFVDESQSLREALRNSVDEAFRLKLLGSLGETVADLHNRGVIQPDGNLTNFLLGTEGTIWVIDEDDVEVYPQVVSPEVAQRNLANIASRVLNPRYREALVRSYLEKANVCIVEGWRQEEFWRVVREFRFDTEMKWQKRNISTDREFD